MLKFGILDLEGKKYTLRIGQEYLVGRKSIEYFHDIEIEDQSVDIKHSIIDLQQNSSPVLFDVCSKQGTFVDDLKIPRFKSIPLGKISKIRFGNVETYLQLVFEGDSGFLEERLNSPNEDTSEIICNTPEKTVSLGSRLKNCLKSSLTSTPNESTASRISKPVNYLLIPNYLPRSSIGSNRSADSFYIPETQHATEAANSRSNNCTDISFYSNTSKKNTTVADDDFLIPETQEVVSSAIPLVNQARLAFPSNDNESIFQDDRIPSSQFRICTQDLNESDEDINNESDDILANAPLPMDIMPKNIIHDPVETDDRIKIDDDDIDSEMSALQWSKKTVEDNADGSVTPDGLFDIVGSVTSEIIQVIRKSPDKALSQNSTPDIFAIPEEPGTLASKTNQLDKERETVPKDDTLVNKNLDKAVNLEEPEKLATTANIAELIEEVHNVTIEVNLEDNSVAQNEIEYPPTQAFFKPIPCNNSITKLHLPPPEPEDDCDVLPETQVFAPPTIKSKPVVIPHTTTQHKVILANNHDKPNTSTTISSDSGNVHVFALPQASPKPRASLKPQVSPKPTEVSLKLQASQKSSLSTMSADEDDDLPPTQVFTKDDHITPAISGADVITTNLFNFGVQLSDNSFKATFDKLLDSDDDEMDEAIAPDLVKQMRSSLDKPVQPELSTADAVNKSAIPSPKKKENTSSSDNKTPTTPDCNKFRYPSKAPKPNYSKAPAVSIDNFLLTPDFLGKEFSKDSRLQKEAEVNWRNIVLEKRNGELFRSENKSNNNLANSDSDASEDSFIDLLPKRLEKRSKSVDKSSSEKVEKSKVEEKVVYERITRRKSALLTRCTTTDIDNEKESKKRGKKKNEQSTIGKDKTIENNSKMEKSSRIAKDSKVLTDPINLSLVTDSRIVKSELVKDSKVVKEDTLSKKHSLAKESSAITDFGKIESRTVTKVSSSTCVNTSKEHKEKIESAKYSVGERKRTHRKIEEPPKKEEDKSIRTRASKRNAEAVKYSSKASKINKLDGLDVDSRKQNVDKILPRRTLPKTNSELIVDDKKSKAVKPDPEEVMKTSSKSSKINKLDALDVDSKQNGKKTASRVTRLTSSSELTVPDKKDALKTDQEKTKKKEPAKQRSTTKTSRDALDLIDLTDSDIEEKTVHKRKTKRRKSQEEYICRKSPTSTSQSSVENNDLDRSLRRKKKLKIAITSCSPATRDILVRYTGRIWEYTEDPKECDVLLLEAGNRTFKLLIAIARGVPVVKVDWLKEVLSLKSTNVSFDKHIFEEANFQLRHKFVMRESLQLARTSSLFKGMSFMMTPNITPKPDEMKDIIIFSGGTVLTSIPNSGEFYLVSENIDNQLWYRYRRASQEVKVVTAISLMASVMQQSLGPLIKSVH